MPTRLRTTARQEAIAALETSFYNVAHLLGVYIVVHALAIDDVEPAIDVSSAAQCSASISR